MKLLRTVFGALRHLESTVFEYFGTLKKLEQLLRARGDRTGAGGAGVGGGEVGDQACSWHLLHASASADVLFRPSAAFSFAEALKLKPVQLDLIRRTCCTDLLIQQVLRGSSK